MAKGSRPGEIMLLMQRAQRDFEQRLTALLAERGFSEMRPAYGAVFRNLAPGGSRITDIAQRAGMTKQAIGLLVTSMEEAGIVERVPDPADGRAKIVRMTPGAAARTPEVLEVIRGIERENARKLGADGLAELERLLRVLVGREEKV